MGLDTYFAKGWVMGIISTPWGRGALPALTTNPKREAAVESHPSKNGGWGTQLLKLIASFNLEYNELTKVA